MGEYICIEQTLHEVYKHQELLLPYTSPYLGRTNLDVGCGTGLTSVIHQQALGVLPTLCDVVDIRHTLAKTLPFYLLKSEALPFRSQSFDSAYIQYVLHHLPTSSQIIRLIKEALRVSDQAIIVEETTGDRTDVARARLFDKEVNKKIHLNISMPVYRYYSSGDIERLIAKMDGKILAHRVISNGSEDNGFLETHLFVVSLK